MAQFHSKDANYEPKSKKQQNRCLPPARSMRASVIRKVYRRKVAPALVSGSPVSSNLTVELQQVVRRKAGDRSLAAEALMGAVMVVGMKPGQQGFGALLGMIVGPGVSPFAQSGLDEAFSLAVGARGIGTGKDVPHPAAAAQVGNKVRTVGGAVVGHDASDRDPQGLEVIEGAHEEACSGFLALVGQNFRVGQARMVVDADVSYFEAGPETAFLVSAGDARADPVEAAELLGVEVEQVAGRGILVANDGRRRVQRAQPGQSGPLKQAAYGGDAELESCGDRLHQEALAAQRDRLVDQCWRRRAARSGANQSWGRQPPPRLRGKTAPPTCARSCHTRPPPPRRSWAILQHSPA